MSPPPDVEQARQAEEGVERVDVSALVGAMASDASTVENPPPNAARLQVRVLDEAGAGLAGAHLVLESLESGALWRTRSGAGGRAWFADLPAGIYRLRAELAGRTSGEETLVEVGGSQPAAVEVRLARAPRSGRRATRLSAQPVAV